MGLKGNGKGHPLVKQDSSEIGDGEDDYEEGQAMEGRLETRRFRDRSQLKQPTYTDHILVRESIEEDDICRPIKKAKRTRRSKHQVPDGESAETPVSTSEGMSGNEEFVKIEPEPYSPFDTSFEGNDSNGPLNQPLVNYFGMQANNNDTLCSFSKPPYTIDYGICPTTSYQTYSQPSFTATQPFVQQQMAFPQSFNANKFGLPNTFEGFHKPERYNDWFSHDPQS